MIDCPNPNPVIYWSYHVSAFYDAVKNTRVLLWTFIR
jgi:hypothetical protein